MRLLRGPFWGESDYMVLICSTSVHNKTCDGFIKHNLWICVINCPQEEVELWLKVSSYFSQGTNTLVVLDHLTAMKDVKGSTGHAGISVWVLTQQITSISKPFCENVAAIVLFYTPSGKSMKAIFEDYASELSPKSKKKWRKIFSSCLCRAPPFRNQNF